VNEVAVWIASKGLSLSVSSLQRLLRPPESDRMTERLIDIDSRLDALIAAPYLAAVTHLREGDLHECRRQLISAMATDELNLPARLHYCYLMQMLGKPAIALDH
jgi:hypothetical protein